MARRRSGKKIDFVHWTRTAGSTLALGAGTSAINANAAQHEPETLLRFRGNLLAYLDAVNAPGALVTIGVGLILVPEGTGTTVLWSPLTDSDAPWIWYEGFSLGLEEGVTDIYEYAGVSVFRAIIDNKAMRITRNQETQLVFENITVGAAASVNIRVEGRTLAGT